MTLLPIMAAVLAGFFVIGAALPVLPLHVNRDLGFGTFVIGLVAGAQFAASIVTRIWAGGYSDANGGKRSVLLGLVTAAVAGLLYLLSMAFVSLPVLSVAILLLGRAVLGGAESFIITGGVSWGLAMVDSGHAGKVIAWVGTAMLPLLVLLFLLRAPSPPLRPRRTKSALGSVIGAVWLPGFGAALSSIGYCAILAFSSLLYSNHGWRPVWLAFTAFGAALMVARIIFGHLPDKLGGAKVALVFVLVQSAGLTLIGLAQTTMMATAGAALAGFGYSLVYPGMGVEAVRGTSPESRGLAMGIYTVFLDVAMALGSPILGWIAGREDLSVAIVISAGITLCTAAVALLLLNGVRTPRDFQMPRHEGDPA